MSNISFNETVDRESCRDLSYFELKETSGNSNVDISGAALLEGDTVISLNVFLGDYSDYILYFSGIKDEKGNAIITGKTFAVTASGAADASPPEIVHISANDTYEITVYFSENIAAYDKTDFSIYKQSDTSVYYEVKSCELESDSTSLKLAADYITVNETFILEASNIEDIAGSPNNMSFDSRPFMIVRTAGDTDFTIAITDVIEIDSIDNASYDNGNNYASNSTRAG